MRPAPGPLDDCGARLCFASASLAGEMALRAGDKLRYIVEVASEDAVLSHCNLLPMSWCYFADVCAAPKNSYGKVLKKTLREMELSRDG